MAAFASTKALGQVMRILEYAAAGVGGAACIATRHGDLVAHAAPATAIEPADLARWGAVVCATRELEPSPPDVVSRELGPAAIGHAMPLGRGYVLALLAPSAIPGPVALSRLRRARPLLERMLRPDSEPAPPAGGRARNLA